jgi:type II restriction/modification system DNA methylase subunit YeeA
MLPFAYKELKQYWNKQTQELMQIEQKINNSYLNLYCLLNEITDEVPLHEVTLLRNVVYRYGARNNQQELEVFDKADTMKEFISYAVGCMFGRYSLDKPGLILADQGETLQDYLRQVPDPSFTPDEDNVLPILDGDWFQDDIKERFKKFLKVTFGEEHYEENLQFIEDAIGRDIRSYFLKEFYPYHLKMYKKRPIYWLFSSPKGTFNALIYMHRYNKDTVSIILNNYLREFKSKLEARKSFVEKISNSTSISPKEKTAAIKELETLKKQLDEITTYESKVLFPLAAKHIEIDLDDGVKANYPKFGEALVKIPGLVDKSE